MFSAFDPPTVPPLITDADGYDPIGVAQMGSPNSFQLRLGNTIIPLTRWQLAKVASFTSGFLDPEDYRFDEDDYPPGVGRPTKPRFPDAPAS